MATLPSKRKKLFLHKSESDKATARQRHSSGQALDKKSIQRERKSG
jgi:hypothetical protein